MKLHAAAGLLHLQSSHCDCKVSLAVCIYDFKLYIHSQ